MKRITLLLTATALLLAGCAEAEDVSSEVVITSEYIDIAHDKLENYAPSEDVSKEESHVEESDLSDVSDNSDYSIESESEDISEDSSEDSSDISDVSDVSIEESKDESSEPESRGEMFLITADITYEDGSAATLVCTSQYEIDLYFGNGTNFTGMQIYEECLKRAQLLFETCEKHIANAEKVDTYPLPDAGYTYVYMKTTEGVYRISYTNTEIHLGPEGEIEICILNAITNITKHAPQ